MPTYVEYELEDGLTILVEAPKEQAGSIVKASRDADGNVILRASKNFEAAMDGVRAQAALMRKKLASLRADEVEVTFGLSTSGELGHFAIVSASIAANYTVTLKWKNTEEEK